MKRREDKKGKIAEELITRFEEEWEEKKKQQAEELHNDLVDVLLRHKADVYTTLYVLEMLKYETLKTHYDAIMAKEGAIRLSDREPTPITQ